MTIWSWRCWRQRLAVGQDELDPEPARRQAGGPLPITSTLMGVLDALERAYPALGLNAAARVDEVFAHSVLARIIDPIGKLDACGYSRKSALRRRPTGP
jgi:hypothetical protein